jgi:hypothetical protein
MPSTRSSIGGCSACCGARATGPSIEADLRLDAKDFTAPMLEELRTRAARPPFRIAHLSQPKTSRVGDEDTRTPDQVATLRRLTRQLEAIGYLRPAALTAFDRLLTGLAEHMGLDEDDWKD